MEYTNRLITIRKTTHRCLISVHFISISFFFSFSFFGFWLFRLQTTTTAASVRQNATLKNEMLCLRAKTRINFVSIAQMVKTKTKIVATLTLYEIYSILNFIDRSLVNIWLFEMQEREMIASYISDMRYNWRTQRFDKEKTEKTWAWMSACMRNKLKAEERHMAYQHRAHMTS